MAARRSRTGCATCRSRKLKCDEVKPICGHCAKSRRECVPSEGVPFRHEQNAGLNAKGPGLKLANFYKDRPIFTPEQTQNFLPIPASLQWRHITDPYNEHDLEQSSPRPASPQAYQQQIASAASHSLTMLASVAAPGNQTYQPPITYDASIYPGGNVGYGPAGSLQGPNQISSIPSLLNHDKSNADSNNIDPSLDTSIIEGLREAAENAANHSSSVKHGADITTEGDHNVANEEELRALLKGYDGQTA